MQKRVAISLVFCLAVGVGCGDDGQDQPDEIGDDEAAIYVMVDADGPKDVQAARLTMTDCEDSKIEIVAEEAELDAWSVDSKSPSSVGDTQHLAVEDYRQVQPGCYDVTVELLDADGQALDQCTRAVGKDIEVSSGETTEVLLYSRCRGEGGPSVEMLQFGAETPTDCDNTVDVCATVYGHGSEVALNWSWAQPDGSGPYPEVLHSEQPDFRRVECTKWPLEDPDKRAGLLEAYPARAETTDGGRTVLFTDTHEVSFPLEAGCNGESVEVAQD